MRYGKVWLAGGLLGALLWAGGAWAVDDVACEMPNPFAPVPIHTESRGAEWRHGFHKMRTTWCKYFQVIPKELDGYEETTLDKVRADPTFYLDRKLHFDLYFAKNTSFFKPFITPFHQDSFLNYGCWSYAADLWTKDGRASILPLFYVDRRRKEMIDKMTRLPMYTPIHVWAQVRTKSEGLPWFEVMAFEIIPETTLSDAALRHIELGANQLNKKRYELAAQALEVAVKLELPTQVEVKVYSMLARAYYELRAYSQARNALVNAVLRDDSSVPNLVLLARADLRLDRADEAKQAAARAVTLEPGNPEARAELGLALAVLGDILDAYKELDFALRLAPRNQLPEAFRNRAVVATLEGKLDLAVDEISKALLLRPTDYILQMELGDIYALQSKLDKALVQYNQAKELAPQRPEPFYKTASVLKIQADALAKENKPEDAKKLYDEALSNVRQAISKDPHYMPAYSLEADLLRATNKEGEIKKSLEKGAKANPKSLQMQEIYYEQAKAGGDWVGMEDAARAALALKATGAGYNRLGYVLSSKPVPDYPAAAEAYEQAVTLDPKLADDWAALGHIRAHFLSEYAGAEAALVQAVKLQPANASAWYDLALSRRQLGDNEGALAALEESLKLLSTPPAKTLGAQLRLDRRQPGDPEAAADLAKAAAADAGTDADKALAQSTLATALLHAGKVTESLDAFAAADANIKDNPEYQLWYGVALLKNNDLSAAQPHLQTAVDQTKTEATALTKRIQTDAQKALRNLAKIAKGKGKPATETVKEKKPDETPSTAKKLPPVIEDEEKETVPVPIEVPGPR